MKFSLLNWFSLLLVVLLVALTFWYGPQLPDPVPSHWNMQGVVDGWTAKPWGVWMMPLICLGTFLLLLVLPAISPRGFRLESARRAYDLLAFFVLLLFAAITITGWQSALGSSFSFDRMLPILLGGFLVLAGNYLPKFPKNFFIGIRTPWTLSSDEVWRKTHRLGGWVFMVGGLASISAGLMRTPTWVGIVCVTTAAIVPAVYSFLLYRRLHGFIRENDNA